MALVRGYSSSIGAYIWACVSSFAIQEMLHCRLMSLGTTFGDG